MDLANLGLRLAKLREAKGISARDMSLRLGMSANYINKIETGKSCPSMESFFNICIFLGVSQSEFFDEEISNPERFSELVSDFSELDDSTQSHVAGIVKELRKNK